MTFIKRNSVKFFSPINDSFQFFFNVNYKIFWTKEYVTALFLKLVAYFFKKTKLNKTWHRFEREKKGQWIKLHKT